MRTGLAVPPPHCTGCRVSRQAVIAAARSKSFVWLRIPATDRQIDRLVYELYGLTEQEIALVEGA